MKNLCTTPAWNETPRTNVVVEEVQSRMITFDVAFYRLLELTRSLEVENTKRREAGKGNKKKVAKKRPERVKTPRNTLM